MSEDLVVIPLPLETGGVTYAVARLISIEGEPFAEAMFAVPGTMFSPPRRISLSRYGLARIRPGNAERPELYFYEGVILPPPPAAHN